MKRDRKLLFILIGFVILVALVAAWAKHDADAKAATFTMQRAKVAAVYTSDVSKLKLSTRSGTGITSDTQEATLQQGICNTAASLESKVASLNLSSSIGNSLSSSYRSAEAHQADDAKVAGKLKSYAALCNYFVFDTRRAAEQKAVEDSDEYTSLLVPQGDTCPEADCVPPENGASFAAVYQKILAIDTKYSTQYQHLQCPLPSAQKSICDGIVHYEKAIVVSTQKYVDALKTGNADAIAEASKNADAYAAYANLNTAVQKFDSTAKDINVFYGKILATHEAELQKQSV
ncbi:MAG TPA: hypothetical protein VN031_03065 [Candidatus Microsaccharimonas sp.]|nr:hypothetical protein [Candidatus Microsaccharimonas sp.]